MREDEVRSTFKIADAILADLKQLSLAAIPRNFELWHVHLAELDPKLSAEIERLKATDEGVTEAVARDLYERFIKAEHLPGAVLDVASRVETEIGDVLELLAKSGDSARDYGKQLSGASNELNRTDANDGGMRNVLKSLVAATRQMEVENKALEERLANSSQEITKLQRSMETIRMEAFTDPLTGVGNRKCFDTSVKSFMAEAEEQEQDLCIALADIDHFKKFNDTWGHQTGDQVLRLVAAAMDANIKGQDLLARYGGEEFAILLPRTSLDNAAVLSDRIRRCVETRRLRKRSTNEDLGAITISIGVAAYRKGETIDQMIERADDCLYEAKRRGRNLVVREDEHEDAAELVAARA